MGLKGTEENKDRRNRFFCFIYRKFFCVSCVNIFVNILLYERIVV